MAHRNASTPMSSNTKTPKHRAGQPLSRNKLFIKPSNTITSSEEKSFMETPSKDVPNKLLLSSWGLPQKVLEKYWERGIRSMFKWQSECLSLPGVLAGANLVFSAPTSAGKTLVAELIALKCVLETKKKVIVILPFVSVAHEKAAYLQSVFEPQGVRVGGFMGNQSPPGGFSSVDIAICTIEKANSLMNRLLEERAVHELGAVIVDELHMIGDSHRGYLLELLLTKVLYIERVGKSFSLKIQVIGMSATLPNINVLAKWLGAQLYCTDFRPTPLKEMVKIGSTLYDTDFKVIREFSHSEGIPGDEDDVLLICRECISKGHSVLIFCPTKAWCESLAATLAEAQGRLAQCDQQPGESRQLLDVLGLVGVCEQLRRTQVGLDKVLEKTVPNGVAFHHAGLTFEEREIIEGAFRQVQVRVLVTTTTLSSGVNLPARLVIVRTPFFQRKLVDILTYKQMSGRAGRKGVDEMGESILMCKASEKSKVMALFKSDPKPVRSCLCSSKANGRSGKNTAAGETFALKRALLEVITSGVAVTEQEVALYSSCTLFYAELQLEAEAASGNYVDINCKMPDLSMQNPLSEAMQFLLKNDFIATRPRLSSVPAPSDSTATGGEVRDELFATQLGAATVASALSPEEALVVFKEMRRARKKFVLENELHIIYLVTPVYVQDQWPSLDWYRYLCIWERLPDDMKQVSDILGIRESFLAQAVQGILPERLESQRQALQLHRRFFTALALHDLVHEVPITHVARRYGASKGLLQTLQSAAGTFAGMVTVFCNRLGWTNLELLFSQFQSRLTFGVERVLCDLVTVSLLNGFRARVLYNEGYHTLASLAAANPVAIETCLRNAIPFKSYKVLEDGEHQEAKSSASRTWCARLRKGLTESEAAVLIVSEAQAILSKQLSVPVSAWSAKGLPISRGSGGGSGDIEGEPSNNAAVERENVTPLISLGNNRKRTRPSLRGCVSGPFKMSSPREIQIPNNGISHFDKPSGNSTNSGAAPVDHVPASTPYQGTKKFKPSPEKEVVEESLLNSSQEGLVENCLGLSPIAVQSDAKISAKTTPECSIHTSMLFSGTLSFSLTDIDSERAANKAEPLTIPDSFQCTPDSFSFQTYAMIDAACAANEREEEDGKGKASSNEILRSLIHAADSLSQGNQGGDDRTKMDLLSPVQLDFRLTQFIQETPSNKSVSFLPSGLRELSSLTSSQFSQSGLTVINVTSNRILFDTFVSECMEQKSVAFSVATTNVDHSEGIGSVIVRSTFSGINTLPHLNQQVVGVAFCWGGMDVYYVSLCKDNVHNGGNCDDDSNNGVAKNSHQSDGEMPLEVRVSALQKLFRESSWLDVTAYDMKKHAKLLSLCCKGTMPQPRTSRDPVVASWMLDTDAREKTVHKMVLQYLPDQPFLTTSSCEDSEEVPLSSVASNSSDPEMQASAESVLAFALGSKLESLLKAENLYDAYVRLEMPSLLVLAKIELNGIGFSPEECSHQKDVLQFRLSDLEQEAYSLAGHTFSLTSSEDIASVLYLELGLPSGPDSSRKLRGQKGTRVMQRKTNANRAKHLSTAKEVLEKIKTLHPLPGLVLEWRRISATLTKMVFPLLKCAVCGPTDEFRVYPTVQIHTATGRVAFSEPSIQMVPKEFDIGTTTSASGKVPPLMSDSQYLEVEAEHTGGIFSASSASVDLNPSPSSVSMRSVFHAREGGVFLAADYSQLELRILAHMCGDRKLKQFLNSDGDAFKMIAAEWLGIPASAVSSDERQNAKQVCYGMVYGIGAKALGEQLGISDNDASQFMETFRSKYPAMKRFISQVVQDCREKGFVTTLLGRKRFLSGISSSNVHAKSQAERQAVNTTIQGSAADLVKTAMVNIDARVEKLHPCSTCFLPSSSAAPDKGSKQCWAWLVLQLHDELIYEVSEKDLKLLAGIVQQEMENALQLSVKFPVKLKAGHSWGDLKPFTM